jgi:hypothetical protein
MDWGDNESFVGHHHVVRPAARRIGRALTQGDYSINKWAALEGRQSGVTGTSSAIEDRHKTAIS